MPDFEAVSRFPSVVILDDNDLLALFFVDEFRATIFDMHPDMSPGHRQFDCDIFPNVSALGCEGGFE